MDSYKLKLRINLIILLAVLSSCSSNKTETVISGVWTIDTISYKNQDIIQCLGLNVLTFKKDNNCELPVVENCNGINDYNRNGSWKIIDVKNTPVILNILSENRIFNGKYTIKFMRDDEKKLLKMKIQSDSVYWISSKTFFDYDDNTELINYLVQHK